MNLTLKNKHLFIGKKFKISEGSGIDSNKIVTLTSQNYASWCYNNNKMYFPSSTDKNKVIVMFDNGKTDFMFINRLIPIN